MRLMTPRPMPNRRVPVLAGGAVVGIALLVFLAAGWEIRGWALGAVLWVAAQVLGFLLGKAGIGQPNVHGSGVVAFGMMARGILLMVVLIAVAVSNPSLALAGAVVYALAYTAELGMGLSLYFSGEARS